MTQYHPPRVYKHHCNPIHSGKQLIFPSCKQAEQKTAEQTSTWQGFASQPGLAVLTQAFRTLPNDLLIFKTHLWNEAISYIIARWYNKAPKWPISNNNPKHSLHSTLPKGAGLSFHQLLQNIGLQLEICSLKFSITFTKCHVRLQETSKAEILGKPKSLVKFSTDKSISM